MHAAPNRTKARQKTRGSRRCKVPSPEARCPKDVPYRYSQFPLPLTASRSPFSFSQIKNLAKQTQLLLCLQHGA